MRRPVAGRNVVKFKFIPSKARQRVGELARDTGNITWTDHIVQRMRERGFDTDAVLRILRTGDVEDDPEEEDPGDWKIKIVRKMANGRVAGVVTVVVRNSRLVLITVEWEDRR